MIRPNYVSDKVNERYENNTVDHKPITLKELAELGRSTRKDIERNEAYRSQSYESAARDIMK